MSLGHPAFTSLSGSQKRRSSTAPPADAQLISPEILVDEERVPGYNSAHYYPANPGDVLENRYQLHAKIGWGSSSTVWLAQDIRRHGWLRPKRYVAVKICNCDVPEEDLASELDMNTHLSTASLKHRGRAVLGTAIEGYEVKSPRGNKHLVLVFEPLREPLWLLRRRITHQNCATRDSLPVLKAYLRVILDGLDYMHSQCHVIHTDLKLDNIMVTFEDPSTIDAFVREQAAHPMARKRDGQARTVYRCHNDFGPIQKGLGKMIPQITDFGLAQRGDRAEPLIHPIQPDEFRAPEVLLGIGWSYSADVWNLGTMVWELLAGRSLFHQPASHSYSAAQHLADMSALLGEMPPSLVRRERDMRHWRWSPAAVGPDGRLCSNAAELYNGPFITDEGTFAHRSLIPRSRRLEAELPQCILEEDCVPLFVKFMRRMLCWVPEERATAAELLGDPWLDPCSRP
ncbi:Serine/threonine-protein kinase SRPK [Colletotrichum tanaceti]|uniref:non-specific serine/threonine protein kinase n=1 Tax=Colletotrichum tanaceti TaxID=1306861 RepID=A0A4U6X750_9PEZI|nr:Serine/threonine-protein kinase SRPK [Colletotrichum tanaceti]TKW51311.1 Serine/threonine-protein kinase SRPK [Colletotrichum tanaceti]